MQRLQSLLVASWTTGTGQEKTLTHLKWLNTSSFLRRRAIDSTERELLKQICGDAKTNLVTELGHA